jgi:hypothetical protein
MTESGKPLVELSGIVDFAGRRDSITFTPAQGQASYPPYQARFVDGWNYVEVAPSVRRPPTVHTTTMWLAFQDLPSGLPVPDRTMPPEVPIDVINLPLTQPMVNAHFVDAPGTKSRHVAVRFGRGRYSGLGFTYSLDASERIEAVTSRDVARGGGGGNTLAFVYGPDIGTVVAPSIGVQKLVPGENLYPTPTTAAST